jgi:hypothetical protein
MTYLLRLGWGDGQRGRRRRRRHGEPGGLGLLGGMGTWVVVCLFGWHGGESLPSIEIDLPIQST